MALSVRSGGTYHSPHTIWVRSGGEWKRVARASTRSGGVWKSDAPLAVNTPSIVVGTGSIEQPPTLTLTPAPTGAPSPSYKLEEYRYDSNGANRTFFSSKTGTWTSAGITTTMATNPPPGTKLSYELTAIGADGTTVSSTAVTRWQIGVPAVTAQQAVYGWGSLSGWTPASTYFTAISEGGASPGYPLSNALDAAGTSTVYENPFRGAMDPQAYLNGFRLIGNGSRLPTTDGAFPDVVDLYWGSSATRRLDEIAITHVSLVGNVGFGAFSTGFGQWTLSDVGRVGDFQFGTDPAVWIGALTPRNVRCEFKDLNRERAAGQRFRLRMTRVAYWGQIFDTPYGRMVIADISVRVRDWVITGYQTVVVTPAVPGAAW